MKFKTAAALGVPLSAVGFGCWAAGGSKIWTGSDDQEMIRTIQHAVDLGITFFDVAPVYGFGHAETILGQALAGKRQQVKIGTKCGLSWDDAGKISNDLRPATPLEDTLGVLIDLKQAGKIRQIGVSNFSLELTRRAHEITPLASYQGLYNLLERNPLSYHNIPLAYQTEREILPFCEQNGLAFFPYSPLFQGLLTDQFRMQGQFDAGDVRSANPKLNGEQMLRFYEMREKLVSFAKEINRPLSQIAINWLIQQPAVTSVICGAQTIQQISENAASASWELSVQELAQIDHLLQPYRQMIGVA
jgi:aryl-alcohol dehydrogenase-like predicted oxidoreductase